MEGSGVQSLDRAIDIVELLAASPAGLGVTEIGARLSLHKSTVHRLLSSLAVRGFVEREEGGQRYRLGLKFIELASVRLNHLELKTEASPWLRRLADSIGQAVHLAILSGREVVYIDKIEPVSTIRMYSQIGKRIPLYCSSLGKALLSDLEPEALAALAASLDYRRFTPRTRLGPEALLAEVALCRERGWSLDDEEHEEGIRCIGAPIRDYTGRIIAALSVSGDRRVIAPALDVDHGRAVAKAAEDLSLRMGARPRDPDRGPGR